MKYWYKILPSYFLTYTYMSGWHDDGHGDSGKKSGGAGIDMGITSMIGSFFGLASGAGPMKEALKWGGGGHGHH